MQQSVNNLRTYAYAASIMLGCLLLVGCSTSTTAQFPPMTPPNFELGPAVPNYSAPAPLTAAYWQAPIQATNPLNVAVIDRDLAWEQIIDVINDYFKIDREERVRQIGDVLIEGRIETYPLTSATIFEPWRSDVVTSSDRLESTFQTMRRRASVRVIPTGTGLLIELQAIKELEDVERPSISSAGAATFRHDTDSDRNTEPAPSMARAGNLDPRPVANPQRTLGWINQGRDLALEQDILAKIAQRLNTTTAAIRAGALVPQNNPGNVFAAPPNANLPTLIDPNGPASAPGVPPNGSHIGLPPENR